MNQINLIKDRWYCKIDNKQDLEKLDLILNYYNIRKQLSLKNIDNDSYVYNGYSFVSIISNKSSAFDNVFKKTFIEISLDYILNYNVPKENI